MPRFNCNNSILFVFYALVGCGSPAKPQRAERVLRTDDATKDQRSTSSDSAVSQSKPSENPKAPEPSIEPTPPSAPTFALTSPAFQNNQKIPAQYVAKNGGGNQSPPLQWTAAPNGTASFVVQMVDLDFRTPPFIHWLITNIPSSTTQLPAAIPAGNNLPQPSAVVGANQPKSYAGPNPPALHRYELTVYAIKDGETLSLGTDSAANKQQLEAKSLARSTLMGTYD